MLLLLLILVVVVFTNIQSTEKFVEHIFSLINNVNLVTIPNGNKEQVIKAQGGGVLRFRTGRLVFFLLEKHFTIPIGQHN